MSATKKKQPQARRCGTKGPGHQPSSFGDSSPTWLLASAEKDGPWSWRKITSTQLDAVHERLASLEERSWTEILFGKGSGKQNHLVNIDRITAEAQARLQEIGQSDVEQLVSLRVQARLRVWGILSGNAMRVIWWDPQHEICPSELRKT